MGSVVYPPVVTRVNPAGPDVGDPVGAERTFTASCDQPATLTFYLDGDLVHTSGSGIQQASYTFQSAPLGEHTVRVVAANENGSGENYWNWDVVISPPTSPQITRINPLEQTIYDDSLDVTRNFEVEVDQPARIIYILDGDAIYDSDDQYLTTCSVEISAHNYATRIISVLAVNGNGRGIDYWQWIVDKAVTPPGPPEITLIWPNTTTPSSVVGTRVNFSVQVIPSGSVEFFLDEVSVFAVEQLTNSAIYANDSATVGPHTVRISAQNAYGSDQLVVDWTVRELSTPPTVSLNVPHTISNLRGETRIFLAHVSAPCRLQWLVDGVYVAEMDMDPLTVGNFAYNTSRFDIGQHTLSVIAINELGSDLESIIWLINDPYDIVRQVYADDTDADSGGLLKITATLNERRDGSRFVEIAYNAGIGADILKDQQMGDAYFLSGNFEIEVTVSWPIITIPNDVVEYPKEKIHSDTPLNHGSISIEVPNSSIYHVHVELVGDCTYVVQDQGFPVGTIRNVYKYNCYAPLSF